MLCLLSVLRGLPNICGLEWTKLLKATLRKKKKSLGHFKNHNGLFPFHSFLTLRSSFYVCLLKSMAVYKNRPIKVEK